MSDIIKELGNEIDDFFHYMDKDISNLKHVKIHKQHNSDLEKKIARVQHEIEDKKKAVAEAQASVEKTKEAVQKLHKQDAELKYYQEKLETKEEVLSDNCAQLKKECIISPEDEEKMALSERKSRLYQSMTGIKWDCLAPEDIRKGFIMTAADTTEPFKYDTNNVDQDTITDLLWQKIGQAGKIDWNAHFKTEDS